MLGPENPFKYRQQRCILITRSSRIACLSSPVCKIPSCGKSLRALGAEHLFPYCQHLVVLITGGGRVPGVQREVPDAGASEFRTNAYPAEMIRADL
jgi:hypothetical protein